ncbi:C6 zinc cluster transcription factor-like protein [Conoideocrella luteorostrata]|uniref:C6 zinc cluster transcription factor-like protein n=1 Tax=Conoideocrella luteorostrata TaxID=1105319 RepID=A0AAJ0CJI3_9HYPO|nr:C6 zinc cluster transcription factor-like protein [Conoideocrella luteorostrata]
MVLERIYVVRHGFRSSWSVDPKSGVYSGIPSPTGIQGDPALTSYGIDQSKEMGRHLMTLSPKVERVYSSPFYRCLQTMAPFIALQQQQIQNGILEPGRSHASGAPDSEPLLPEAGYAVTKILPEHGIREWFGSAPFDHPEPAAPEVLKAMFPSYDETYVSAVKPSKRGETLEQLQERIAKALRVIIEQCDADGTRAIVLCSHAAVIILIGRILTGDSPATVDVDDFHAYTCGLSVYGRGHTDGGNINGSATRNMADTRDGRGPILFKLDAIKNLIGGWDCHMNSDCSFLSGGPERGWRFSGDESFPDTGSVSQTEVDSKL